MGNFAFLADLSLYPTALTFCFLAHTAHCLHNLVLAFLPPHMLPDQATVRADFFSATDAIDIPVAPTC